MTDSPAATVAAILRYIESYRKKHGTGPPGPKAFRENERTVARIVGVGPDGETEIVVVNNGHAWRLATFGAARRVKVAVRIDPGMAEA